MQVVVSEIGLRYLVIRWFTHGLVGGLFHDGSLVERLEIAVEIHGVVAGGEGGCQLSFGGCILHDQVDRTTNAITLLVGCQ